MFKGVRTGPLPTSHMTTESWMRLPVRGLRVDELYATQEHLIITAIMEDAGPSKYCADPYPHVVIMPDGEMFLEDGHHRAIRTALTGRRVIAARVLDLQDQQ